VLAEGLGRFEFEDETLVPLPIQMSVIAESADVERRPVARNRRRAT
jgi:hypothetical protein